MTTSPWRRKLGETFLISLRCCGTYAQLLVLLLNLAHWPAYAQPATNNSDAQATPKEQTRFFVVNSFHPEDLWDTATQRGLVAGLVEQGFLQDTTAWQTLQRTGAYQTDDVVIEMAWLNAKRNNTPAQLADATQSVLKKLRAFQPSLVFLGDNHAINYIGNALVDTTIPVVFWGLNGLPLKYGLVNTIDNPERNVTGVWQSGFHAEAVRLLKRLVPDAETFGIIADDSVTARTNVKQLKALAADNQLELTLKGVVQTPFFADYQERTLALAQEVDAFFILHHGSLRDAQNIPVDNLTVARWYLENINIPEVSNEGQFVRQGMLAAVDESGYQQARMATKIARMILVDHTDPGRIRVQSAASAPIHVNKMRADALDITLTRDMTFIDNIVLKSLAFDPLSDRLQP